MVGAIAGVGYTQYVSPYKPVSSVQGSDSAASVAGTQADAQVRAASEAQVRVTAIPEAQTGTPVQPVTPVKQVTEAPVDKAELLQRMQSDPVEMAVRSRIEYIGDGAAAADGKAVMGDDKAVAGGDKAVADGRTAMGDDAAAVNGKAAVDDKVAADGRAAIGDTAAANGKNVIDGKAVAGTDSAAVSETKSAQEVMEESECQTCANRKYQDGSDDPGVSFKTASHIAPEQAASKVRGHEMEHVGRERAEAMREDREVVSQSVTYQTDICPECGKVYVSGGTTRTVTAAQNDATMKQAQENAGYNGGFLAVA